ncbi:MAG: hypothetical protein WCF07_00180 [Nitrososphaeraceae archaeon]
MIQEELRDAFFIMDVISEPRSLSIGCVVMETMKHTKARREEGEEVVVTR